MAVDFENRIDDSVVIDTRIDDSLEIDLSAVMAVKVPMPTTLQDKTVEPTTSEQVLQADKGYDGLGTVIVKAVTPDIDIDIQPEDIREGKDILGVVGTLKEREDLDAELAEQESLIAELESEVNELPDKPVDRLQWKCDNLKSLYYEFSDYKGESLDHILNGLDTSKVLNFSHTFNKCSKITSINLNSGSATTITYAFYDCRKLKNIIISTSSATNINNMCYYCTVLESISELDYTNMLNSKEVFQYCHLLKELNIKNTSKCKDFTRLCYTCSSLTSVQTLDLISATTIDYMFTSCTELENLILKNIKLNLQVGSGAIWGAKLNDNSIVGIFQELHDNTDNALGGTRTLTLSTPSNARTEAIYVKLIDVTDEMRAEDEYIDNKKPCVVCESTDEGAMTLKEYGISKNWNIA